MATFARHEKWIWLFQFISGLLLYFFVGLHWYLQHYAIADGLRNFEQVLNYLSNWWALPLEWLLLITVTGHALAGIRAILLDCGFNIKRVNRTITTLYLLIVIYGVELTLRILRWK